MSLSDGTSKMSKSVGSDHSRILLTDSADTIVKKIMRAKSDSIEGISFNPTERPEISNLLTIFAALSGETVRIFIWLFL
jgi:tryptophanyl-tRNA synthetase